MPPKRLFLPDLTDQHLTMLLRCADHVEGRKVGDWLLMLGKGEMALWDLGTGLIGLCWHPGTIYVELIIGSGLIKRREELRDWLLSFGCRVEGFARRPGLERLYKCLGARSLGTYMRIE